MLTVQPLRAMITPKIWVWRCPLKAAVLYETKQPLVIEQVDLDEPKNGEVLVKIGAAGICRSDRHFMHGDARINLPVC
ncbi:MAG: hypothetical protein CM1200mP35_05190 [Chloroflexota bacterium]|nr:MAG: hypothetical protein CM1200mP35_05190 [Chloroflexota bacterium]